MSSPNQLPIQIPPRFDAAQIAQTVRLLVEPGGWVELRCPKTDKGVVSGYYQDMEALTRDASQWSGIAEGVYLTLNSVHPDLRARARNRYVAFCRVTTADKDILRRRWLLVDFDAVRIAGVSANDQEHEAALERARTVREALTERGWPAPIYADSGNGAHLLYRLDLPNDDDSLALVRQVLAALAAEFSDEAVTVDRATFNASRISKVYGTLARKGDNIPSAPGAPGRPHRVAVLLEVPPVLIVVPGSALAGLAALAPSSPPRSSIPSPQKISRAVGADEKHGDYATLDVVQWFGAHLCYGRAMDDRKHAVRCPWSGEHSDARKPEESDTVVWESEGERWPEFHCLHSHCVDRGMGEVIALWGDADNFCAEHFTPPATSWPVLSKASSSLSVGANGAGDPWALEGPVSLPEPPPVPPVERGPVGSPDGAQEFAIERVVKILTDPERFTIWVRGAALDLSSDDFLDFKRLKLICLRKFTFIPKLPPLSGPDGKRLSQQQVYEDLYLAPALATCDEFLPAPPDAGAHGAMWEAVRSFLSEVQSSEDRDDLHVKPSGKLVLYDGQYLFRGQLLRAWLAKRQLNTLAPDELWEVVRQRGGESKSVRTPKGVVRAWVLPGSALNETLSVPGETLELVSNAT